MSSKRIQFSQTDSRLPFTAGAVRARYDAQYGARTEVGPKVLESGTGPESGDLTHQHYFINATETLTVQTGDKRIACVYLDPSTPPQEVMLQWNASWDHRAFWGANAIGFGTRTYMGPLPAFGQWVRLEVPAASIGLATSGSSTLNGMAFTLYGGTARWDHVGKVNSVGGEPVWVKYAVPAGASANVAWTRSNRGLQSEFAFTGHPLNTPSGLHLAPYRAYDASLGRWISGDPIRESGGKNLYGCLNSNPYVPDAADVALPPANWFPPFRPRPTVAGAAVGIGLGRSGK